MLKASSDVASLGSGPCSWLFVDPALLTCWPCSALPAGCCEMGPCQGGTVLSLTVTCTLCLTCSCCSLTLYFPSLLLSLLLLSSIENFLLYPQENRTATLTTSDHLSMKFFHLLPTTDDLNDGQTWKVFIKKPSFYKRERH